MDSMIEVAAETAVLLPEPPPQAMSLEAVLSARGPPVSLHFFPPPPPPPAAKACGTFGLPVGKSTASHHFKVLREAGIIRQRVEGRERLSELRSADLEQRFPGLLESVISA